MRSLRTQLILGMTVGTAGVLLVSAALLYTLISRTLRAQFDESLASRAHSLSALVEEDESGVSFELAELPPPETPEERARLAALAGDEHYQLWYADGRVLARCESLGADELPLSRVAPGAPVFSDLAIPGAAPSRLVTIAFAPRQEFDTRPAQHSALVTLAVRRPLAALHATLARVRNVLIGVCFAAVLVCVAVVAVVVARTLRPIRAVESQIAAIAANDLSVRVRSAALPREVRPIAERLNDMLARLESAFERERRFTGDVAHELRTPLAGLRATLELALARQRAPDDYRDALRAGLRINRQMQCVVENLLELARADAGQLELHCAPLDFTQLVRDAWEPFAERAAARRVSIRWRLDPLPIIDNDAGKLAVILRNLFDNAATYVDDDGEIMIAAGADDATVRLTVANNGCQLTADEMQHVCRRFWRRSATAWRDGLPHCGLGLALSQTLANALGGSLQLNLAGGGTFEVVVQVPRAPARAARPGQPDSDPRTAGQRATASSPVLPAAARGELADASQL